MIQPQPEAWVPESPPPAMETQYSRTNSGPGGRTTSTHLLPDCSDYIWGRTEKAASLAVVSDCRVHYRITPKKKSRKGQATACVRTASSSVRWGHFKTAVKAAWLEQTDKLCRAAWYQADGAGLVLCSDLPKGYMERLHYHHPPPLIQTYIKSSPHPSAPPPPYNVLCSYRLPRYNLSITRWYNAETDHISSFYVSMCLYSQCIVCVESLVD